MPRSERRWRRWVVAAAAVGLAVALVAHAIGGRELPDGPAPVAWNRESCGHCRMLIGDPAFAAQLVTTDGDVRSFDDPGCLFEHLHASDPHVHRLWFHTDGDRWLAGADAGFVPAAETPMGFGLRAVPRSTPGAIDLDAAARAVAARRTSREMP